MTQTPADNKVVWRQALRKCSLGSNSPPRKRSFRLTGLRSAATAPNCRPLPAILKQPNGI